MKLTTLQPKGRRRLAISLVMVSCLLAGQGVNAKPVSQQDVKAAVETWVRNVTADARPEAAVDRMEPYLVGSDTMAWIAHLTDRGYCLCSADDIALPVYLYSVNGTYDPDDPNAQYWLCTIDSRVTKFKERLRAGDPDALSKLSAMKERERYWQDLISGIVPTAPMKDVAAELSYVALPLTSGWGQGYPYKLHCPVLPGLVRPWTTVVGCVATAMSQIMYYWRWPLTGEGTGSVTYHYKGRTNWDDESLSFDPNIPYTWPWCDTSLDLLKWDPGDGGKLMMKGYWDTTLFRFACRIADSLGSVGEKVQFLSALSALYGRLDVFADYHDENFDTTIYQWDLMQDIHVDPLDAGDSATALLCYHTGVSIDMDYGVWGSGAWQGAVALALPDHFRYDSDALEDTCNRALLREEIQWLRPVEMGGQDCVHSFVVYGYNLSTDQYLINSGNPAWPGTVPDTLWASLDSFCIVNQHHVRQIAPENVVKFIGAPDPGDGSPNDPYKNIEQAIPSYPDGAILIFKAGSDNTFAGASVVLDRPCTLKGYQSVIRKQ
jgi:hypothetical protein